MSDKPSIYGFCAAGCRWETIHKEDAVKVFEPFVIEATYNPEDNSITTNYDITTLSSLNNDKYVLHLIVIGEETNTDCYINLSDYRESYNHGDADETYYYFNFINNDYTVKITKCDDEHLNGISIESTQIHANTADEATHAVNADNATNATNAANATTAATCTGNAKTATNATYAVSAHGLELSHINFNETTGAFPAADSVFTINTTIITPALIFIQFTQLGSEFSLSGIIDTTSRYLPAYYNNKTTTGDVDNFQVNCLSVVYTNTSSGHQIQIRKLFNISVDIQIKSVAILPLSYSS